MSVKYGVYPSEEWVVKDVFNECMKTLMSDFYDAVEHELAEELRNAIRDSVYKRVYSVYKPTQYVRRADKNGLSDTSQYITEVYSAGNIASNSASSTVEVYMPFVTDNKWNAGADLVAVIESGDGYTWEHSEIYKSRMPRPFLQEAAEDIINDRSADGAVAAGLMRMGWDINKPYQRKHTPQRDHKSPNGKRVMKRTDAWDGNW